MNTSRNEIVCAFQSEGLTIIDEEQIDELMRWKLEDFSTPHDFETDDYTSDLSVVSVCGAGRTGTTLTRVMLDTHTKIYSGHESYLFLPLEIDISLLSKRFQVDEQRLISLSRSSSCRSEFIHCFAKELLQASGKSIWADKTSRNVHTAGYFFSHFPNGKVIHVIRDPRDAVASLRQHRRRKKLGDRIVNTGYIMPLQLCIERWIKAVHDILPYRQNTHYLEIKYEDLVQNTEATLKRLTAFCGVGFEAEMMKFHQASGFTRDSTNFIQNIEATYPLFVSSVGRYQSDMNAQQLELVVEATSSLATLLGYSF